MARLETLGLRMLGLRSLQVLIARVAGAGSGFAFQVLIARLLGADQVGVYVLALTVSVVAATVARVGMDGAVLKFAARAYAAHDALALSTVERTIVFGVLPVAVSVALLGVVSAPWAGTVVFGNSQLVHPLQLMMASVPMLAVSMLIGELLRACDRQVHAALAQGVALPLLNLVLSLMLFEHLRVAGDAVLIYVAANVMVLLAGIAAWRHIRRNFDGGKRSSDAATRPLQPRQIWRTSAPMFGAAAAAILMTWVDVLLLGVWASSTAVGIYNAATRTALLTSFVLLAINSVVAPRFASAALRHDALETARLARRACLLSSLAALPILAMFVTFSERVLSLFGPTFVAGATALVLVSLGQMVNAMTGPVGHLLNMRGYHVQESRLSVAAAAINVGLCVALIPRLGVVGAAIANASAVAACNLARVALVRRYLGCWIYPRL